MVTLVQISWRALLEKRVGGGVKQFTGGPIVLCPTSPLGKVCLKANAASISGR